MLSYILFVLYTTYKLFQRIELLPAQNGWSTLQLESLVSLADDLAVLVLFDDHVLGHGDRLDDLDVLAERNIGSWASRAHDLGRGALGNRSAVLETVCAGTAGDNEVLAMALDGTVLVLDGLVVGLDGAETLGDNVGVDSDNGLLGKVLLLGALGVGVRDGRVGVVSISPDLADGELANIGPAVRVQAVAGLVDVDGDGKLSVHLDVVTVASGGGSSGNEDHMTNKGTEVDRELSEGIDDGLLIDRGVVVTAHLPGGVAIGVGDLKSVNISGTVSGALGNGLAVLGNVSIIPLRPCVLGGGQVGVQAISQAIQTTTGEGRVNDRLIESGRDD